MNKITNLVDIIQKNKNKDNIGICYITGEDNEKFVSYKSLYSNALAVLYSLQHKGIKSGDEAILLIGDNEKFVNVFWACVLGGIVPVPITLGNNDESKRKLFKVWNILKNPTLITGENEIEILDRFAANSDNYNTFIQIKEKTVLLETICINDSDYGQIHEPTSSEIALIQFSSGSTGDPKGVILTHENLVSNVNAILTGANIGEDSSLSWLPLTHDMGLIGFHISPMASGINHFLMPSSLFIRRPSLWLKKVNQHKNTVLSSPNFGYSYFLASFKPDIAKDWDLSNVRLIFNGAEPICAELCNEFLTVMAPFGLKNNVLFNVYGMAEASLAVSFPFPGETINEHTLDRRNIHIGQKVIDIKEKDDPWAISLVDLGYPVIECCVKICNRDNVELDENIVGIIHIKGKNVTGGYFNNPKATKSIISKDGWLNTGDLGFFRNGRLVVTGREKDVIFIDAQNYYSNDIETIAITTREVSYGQIAACGVFDEKLHKEKVVLFVIYKKAIESFISVADNLKSYLLRQIGLKINEVIPIRKMPKTTSGKVQRYKLVQGYENGEFNHILDEINQLIMARQADIILSDTEKNLMNICCEVLGVENIDIKDNLLEWGSNSIILAKIYERIDTFYPSRISISDVFSNSTITKLSKLIDSRECVLSFISINMPEAYFNYGKELNDTTSFKYSFTDEIFKKISLISKNEGIEFKNVLLSMCIYNYSNITDDKEVGVYTITTSGEEVAHVNINFSGIDNFSELFNVVENELKHEKTMCKYSVDDIKLIKTNKSKYAIIPLFYINEINVGNEFKNEVFDIIFEVQEHEGKIDLILTCNNKHIRRDKVKEMLNLYIKYISSLCLKYIL